MPARSYGSAGGGPHHFPSRKLSSPVARTLCGFGRNDAISPIQSRCAAASSRARITHPINEDILQVVTRKSLFASEPIGVPILHRLRLHPLVEEAGIEPLLAISDVKIKDRSLHYLVSETDQSFQLREVRENGNALEQSFRIFGSISLSGRHSGGRCSGREK